jgi:DNA-directed RNA polymerase subunit K/omega
VCLIMDNRLEPVDKLMEFCDNKYRDARKELAFAILALDEDDPATLYWLAAIATKRASEIS